MQNNIQKSIRIPDDIVAFVDQQPGKDFSKKLVAILKECRDGDSRRKELMRDYAGTIAEIENLTFKLRTANDRLSRITCVLGDKSPYQLSFNDEVTEIIK